MKQDHNAFPQLLTPRLLRIPQREVQNFMLENSSQLSVRDVSLQRSQASPSIPLLALRALTVKFLNKTPLILCGSRCSRERDVISEVVPEGRKMVDGQV